MKSFVRVVCTLFALLYQVILIAQKPGDTNAIKALFVKALEMRDVNVDSSFFLARKGLVLSQKANYQGGIGMAYMRFGDLFDLKDKHDSALFFLRKARHIRAELKDFAAEARTCQRISNVFRAKGNKDSAFFYLFRAVKLYDQNNDTVSIGIVYNELSELYQNYGDFKQALNYLAEASGIFIRNNDKENLSVTYSKYGILYYNYDDYSQALKYFLMAKNIHDSLGNQMYLAKDNNYLGLCYASLGEYTYALKHYSEALTYFRKVNFLYDQAEVYYNVGVCHLNCKLLDSSVFYFEKAKIIATDLVFDELSLKIYRGLSEAYALKGDYTKAYEYQQQYSSLNDSLLNTEKVKSIAEMQTKYETEKKEQQIVLLDQQNKTRSAQRNFFIAGSIVLLLGLFVLGFYYVQRSRISRKNEQIAQEKISSLLKEQEIKTYNAMIEGQEEERKRIATDLHDRLGSMLSTVKLLFSSLNEKIDRNQEEAQTQQAKVTNLLDEAVQEVRRVSHNLSTGMVNTFGLVTALEELCESVDKSGIVRCKLLCYGMDERLAPQTEIGLFRMVQELVNNALKHAKAKQLTIQLNRTGESLNLTVEDDGVGFDLSEKRKKGGIGLSNLEARAVRLGAAYHVDSKPGRGTISIIELPLKGEN